MGFQINHQGRKTRTSWNLTDESEPGEAGIMLECLLQGAFPQKSFMLCFLQRAWSDPVSHSKCPPSLGPYKSHCLLENPSLITQLSKLIHCFLPDLLSFQGEARKDSNVHPVTRAGNLRINLVFLIPTILQVTKSDSISECLLSLSRPLHTEWRLRSLSGRRGTLAELMMGKKGRSLTLGAATPIFLDYLESCHSFHFVFFPTILQIAAKAVFLFFLLKKTLSGKEIMHIQGI